MDINQIIELIKVLVSLISEISWPLVVLFIVVFLRKPIKEILSSVSEISMKAGGFEAQAKRQEIEVAASLGAAVGKQESESPSDNQIYIENDLFKVTDFVNSTFQSKVISRLNSKKILWVDDRPKNNVYETRSLEALGIQITISTSTTDALKKLRQDKYDLIISDMGRPPDNRAGYTLLGEMQKQGIKIPFIIYASSNLPEHKAEARQRGTFGCTNIATELLEMVVLSIS